MKGCKLSGAGGVQLEITDVTDITGSANSWIRRGKKTHGFDLQVGGHHTMGGGEGGEGGVSGVQLCHRPAPTLLLTKCIAEVEVGRAQPHRQAHACCMAGLRRGA